jgi:hypothetical protein
MLIIMTNNCILSKFESDNLNSQITGQRAALISEGMIVYYGLLGNEQ